MKYGSRGCSEILVTFGCRYLVQKHDEPAGSEMKTGTAGLSAEGALNKKGAETRHGGTGKMKWNNPSPL